MSTRSINDYLAVLGNACTRVGLDPGPALPVRLGENAIFRLPGGIVIRIARPGQFDAAAREVKIARWLAYHGVSAVRALPGIAEPVVSKGRAVTFWEELPPHQHGTPIQIGDMLRRLHTLPLPTSFTLAPLAPFVRVADRIDTATILSDADRAWLHGRLDELQDRYAALPSGLPHCVIHGDIWAGNVVSTLDGHAVLLDLERCSIGPPEWDLVSIAIKHTSFAWLTKDDYQQFCDRAGYDVMTWDGFALLRDIRELRMACYLAQHATEHPAAHNEAQHRIACLRGTHGPRPWTWTPASG
ncbi:MAG: phosphotransferase enzyme family protein [Pseudonocardiaceae bacterium]